MMIEMIYLLHGYDNDTRDRLSLVKRVCCLYDRARPITPPVYCDNFPSFQQWRQLRHATTPCLCRCEWLCVCGIYISALFLRVSTPVTLSFSLSFFTIASITALCH
jgi:hypothetical protein